MIIRDAFYGLSRFDEFQKSLGVARNTLSDRLNRLVEVGIFTKELYQDNPPRNAYLLTEMGRDSFPALAGMVAWGDRWLDGGEGAPVSLHHLPCGEDLGVEIVCASCNQPIAMHDVEFRMGPGYPDECPPAVDIRSRLAPATPVKAKRSGVARAAKAKPSAGGKAADAAKSAGAVKVTAAAKARQRKRAS
jgi:DNA-binding HxlR family transcriptional regulator